MPERFALVTVERNGQPVAGMMVRDTLIPIEEGYSWFQRRTGARKLLDGPVSVLGLLEHYPESFDRLGKMADSVGGMKGDFESRGLTLDPSSVHLMAPLPNPPKMLFAGANYTDHIAEMKAPPVDKLKAKPYFFPKTNNCIIGPYDKVKLPPVSRQVDWEVELAVVIGRRCKDVPAGKARDVIAGYTIMNDISTRDILRRTDVPFGFDWVAGKCLDGFAPMGPSIVPSRFIPNPHNLWLKLSVNGMVMQDSNTSRMIFTVEEQIEFLTQLMTLEPGDIISTGTPAGVGAGRGIFLNPGDEMVVAIEELGEQRTSVVR